MLNKTFVRTVKNGYFAGVEDEISYWLNTNGFTKIGMLCDTVKEYDIDGVPHHDVIVTVNYTDRIPYMETYELLLGEPYDTIYDL